MVNLVTDYGTWDLPTAWDGANGLDFREFDTVGGTSVIRLYAPAYALMLQTQDRAASAGAMGFSFRFTWDSGTSAADPGAGKVRVSSATVASITALYVNDADANASDRSGVFALFDDSTSTVKGIVSLVKLTDPSKWFLAKLTATTDGSGFWTLTLTTPQGSDATVPFTAGDSVILGFVTTGDKGETGNIGDITAQPAETTVAMDDLVVIHDTTAGATRKMTVANLLGSTAITSMTVTTFTATAATATDLTVTDVSDLQGVLQTHVVGQSAFGVASATGGVVELTVDSPQFQIDTLDGDRTYNVFGGDPDANGVYIPNGWTLDINQDGTGGRAVTIQKGNELTYSADLRSTAEAGSTRPWTDTNTSITQNAAVGPDGRQTLQKLVEDAGSALHARSQTISGLSPSQTISVSVEVRDAGDSRYIRVTLRDAAATANSIDVYIDPSDGSVFSGPFNQGNGSGATVVIKPLSNSSYRVDLTGQPNTSGTDCDLLIGLNNGSDTYNGDGSSGVYIGNVQVNKGQPKGMIPVGALRALDGWIGTAPNFPAQAANTRTVITILPPLIDGTLKASDVTGS